jgi:uncharacterized protein YjbI with pentapeptide repeats
MSNQAHLRILQKGVSSWNKWRKANPKIKPDLTGAILPNSNFKGINFSKVELIGAGLIATDLSDSNLSKANLESAHLGAANISNANLRGANLEFANFSYADLRKSNLTGAFLQGAIFVKSDLRGATLNKCYVYGISAWEVNLESAKTDDLIVTPAGTSEIRVDNLELAQFIYLLLDRSKIRNMIDTITSKAVLILGRFTPERKVILDSMASELRKYNLLPIIFDFEKSKSRDVTETIKTLAGLCLFVIADITSPKSSPLELQALVPDYQIPFVPIIQENEQPFSMLSDLIGKYDWVLQPVLKYSNVESLLNGFKGGIIDRAWEKHQELQKLKTTQIETMSINDFIKK